MGKTKSAKTKKTLKKYGLKRRHKRKSNMMINLSSRSIIAPHYFAKFKSMVTGFQPVSSARVGSTFTVSGTNFTQPWNTTYPIAGASATGWTVTLGSSTTQVFSGYSVMSKLYANYRVHYAELKVTVTPTAATDAGTLVVAFLPFEQVGNIFTGTWNASNICSLPYAKYRLCTGNNYQKGNTITIGAKNRSVLGMTKNQYNDQLPFLLGSTAVTTEANYFQYSTDFLVYWAENNALANTNQIMIDVELIQYVEFCDPLQPQN